MARKRQTTPAEDLLYLVSLLPWWAGVAIAAIGYVVLHRMAAPVQIADVQPEQASNLVTQTVIAGLATAGQYIVPLFGLAGAAMSFFRRKQRADLVTDVAQANSANALDGMSWREFELLVGQAFRLQGYRVTENGGGGPDGGIDLSMTKGSENFLVQCKQWKAFKVGVNVVRELYGVMAANGATGGFVVTSGRFTDGAKAFAEGRNIQLIDGPGLFSMIKQAKQSLTPTKQQPASRSQVAQRATAVEPACPRCGSSMVKRTARKGGNVGAEFLGCSKFPTCRGVRHME